MPFYSLLITAIVVWTFAAVAVLVGERADRQTFLAVNALTTARANFEKDIAFRRWAAKHGGAYVPVTAETPPNPYLKVPEREISTTSGRQLTLMNPAYMTRQVFEISKMSAGAPQGHITSLNPIRPENAPDAWEKVALQAFEKGAEEYSDFQTMDGRQFFRFMRPMKTEKACLKCHADQGYKEGDIRGGISVSIPVSELLKINAKSSKRHTLIIALVWLLGLCGFWFGLRRVRNASQALQESEERYRQQFQQSQAVMMIIDPDNGAVVDANLAACSYYGYSRKDMLALKISDINTSSPDEMARCIAGVRDGSNRKFLAQHRLFDGTLRNVEIFSNPITFGERMLLHSIIFDVTDRITAERELSNKMDFAESLLHNSTAPTFVIDANHTVLIWNRALEELTGVKSQEIVGTNEHWKAFYQSVRPCLADMVLEGKFTEAQELYTHFSRSRFIPDGMHAEGDYSFDNRRCRLVFSAGPIRDRDGRVIAAIQTLEDITERISLESQLIHAQKMESVGTLAGGVAHDFNNVLTVISGYTDLLKLSLEGDDLNMQFAQEISASVERAADMTRSLLAFSGKHEVLLQYDDLNRILQTIRKSLLRLIREDITLKILAGEERLPVYVDRVQIEQVLINLVVNARDALRPGGTISVATALVTYKEARMEGKTVIPPGDYVCLSVADSGAGMTDEVLEHIFEPFFTTKEKGKGTGLGLSIVHGMVTKHNGHISVLSASGVGTEFRVYLPLYAGEVIQKQIEVQRSASHGGTETVLVVEDDEAIMKLHKDVLGRYGYTVLAAYDGVEAMEIFNARFDEIGIAVVDVIMPRMNGRELVEQIRRRRPELPIIMTSGYTDEIIDFAVIDELRVVFLQKPVRPLDLLSLIQSRLHATK
jgi:PAS domain S-box-containing protein